eukprot:TRINITY_DN5353_c0_g1_i2.p1 TRINITY_DN5353_c0_g1~~TRINITY_DN5353_c0_g1_i2.p1  ORF type:complete len:622 (+),score=134.09 TRINITY_DN5353_c0_g1_i2:163-1866(+)
MMPTCPCKATPQWMDQAPTFCATNGTSLVDYECLLGHGLANCLIQNELTGAQYPGSCGCPNDCLAGMAHGSCDTSSSPPRCVCSAGWGGKDCSLVSCGGQACSRHGTCKVVNSRDTCVCDAGFSGIDCSIPLANLPAVTETVLSTQYSSWDKYGSDHPIFNTSTIAHIVITLDPNDLEFLQAPENKFTKEYQRARMWFHNQEVSEVIEDVGFRTKGWVSRDFAKKSWKISINKFEKGRKWYQMKKLALKGMSMEPSYMREGASADVIFSANGKAQRYAFAQLTVNDIDFGLVVMLENVDEQYLKSRWGSDDGKLYKCVGDLEYLGPDPELYRHAMYFDKVSYDPKTDEAVDGSFSEIRDLAYVLNDTSAPNFAAELEKLLDVDLLIRSYAVEIMTGQTDGMFASNNYFLYLDPSTNIFRFMRHDFDLSLGIFENVIAGDEFATRNVWTWSEGTRGFRLPAAIMSQPQYLQKFTEFLASLAHSFANGNGALVARMHAWEKQLLNPVAQDHWHPLEYFWTTSEFSLSVNETIMHTLPFPVNLDVGAIGLREWLGMRYSSTMLQLKQGPP